jgi:repressor LexA
MHTQIHPFPKSFSQDSVKPRPQYQIKCTFLSGEPFGSYFPQIKYHFASFAVPQRQILIDDANGKIHQYSEPSDLSVLFFYQESPPAIHGKNSNKGMTHFHHLFTFPLTFHLLFTDNCCLEELMPLTRRQKEILNYLKEFLAGEGYSPTLEEIANHFGLASLNGVYKHLRVLEERGFIRRLSNRARSIQIVETEKEFQSPALPLLGYVAAGNPIEAVVHSDEVSVPEMFLTRGTNYVLRVEGDSMIDQHIQDGDLIIVEQREDAQNGETIVALLDGEQATLKKYYREGKQIRLQPENETMSPIFVDESRLKIQGVVVGLMRSY